MKECYELLIPGLRLWVSLGCEKEEKLNPQPVDIDIRISSPREPLGCRSDLLSDVICYKTLVERVIELIKGRCFSLIEYLAAQIYEVVIKQIDARDVSIEIVIIKPNHPIPHVQRGIAFRYKK